MAESLAPLWFDTAPPLATHPRIASAGAALPAGVLEVAVTARA